MRLMVSGPELAAASPPSLAAAVRSLVRQDFIPRFSPDLETEPTLQVEEWAELAAGAEALGESGNGGERRTLEQQKRDLELALDREREAAARQERSLQRYIDRLERRQRERETRLRGQLDDLARTLGRTEYLLLLTRRSWWRRALAWLLGRRLPTFRHASRTHLRTPREARERRAPSGESGPGARRRRTRTGLTKNRGQ